MTGMVFSLLIVVFLMVEGLYLSSAKGRQGMFLAASYLFYVNWGLGFLCVLVISSMMNYIWGHVLRRKPNATRLWVGIALNVVPLAIFKYLPELASAGLWHYNFARQIIMPVGISYWTFQALSYLFDIYFGEDLNPSFIEFSLYLAFWPTVLSGPICRLPRILPQLRQISPFSWDDLSVGTVRLVQGVIMKFILAQILMLGWKPGGGINFGFDRLKDGWGAVDVWLLGLGYGFLLFFDFAGYSNIVIGIGRIVGIRLAENFEQPFLSITPSIFWTRWHMSLSFWIRDYVFNPLAAAGRRYSWWPYAVLMTSMTLFGVWHGARWTFLAYGVFHGLILVLHRFGQRMKQKFSVRLPSHVGPVLSWGVTFALVSLGFVLFRANNLTQAWSMFKAVITPAAYGHYAMPRNFYVLAPTVAVAYFVFMAGRSLLLSWSAAYCAAISQPEEPVQASWPITVANNFRLLVGASVHFLSTTLWWWLAPAVCVLVFWLGLAIHTQSSVIAVTPFVYALF